MVVSYVEIRPGKHVRKSRVILILPGKHGLQIIMQIIEIAAGIYTYIRPYKIAMGTINYLS